MKGSLLQCNKLMYQLLFMWCKQVVIYANNKKIIANNSQKFYLESVKFLIDSGRFLNNLAAFSAVITNLMELLECNTLQAQFRFTNLR